MEAKVIIFDFFGVVVAQVAERWFRQKLPNEDTKAFHKKYIRDVDLGIASSEELFEKLGQLVQTSGDAVRDDFHNLIEVHHDVVSHIKTLKTAYRIALCSNAFSDFIRPILDQNNLNELFEVAIISSEVGLVKPDLEIYTLTADRLGVAPESCVFIDDNVINTQAAESVGMKGVHFTSAADLESQLNKILRQ